MPARRYHLFLPIRILAICLVLTTSPIAHTEELWTGKRTQPTEGNGSAEAPYLISSPEELAWWAGVVNGNMGTAAQNNAAHARLTKDIVFNTNLTDRTHLLYRPQHMWTPIGNSSKHMYAGVFDGNGHVIKGLYGAQQANEGCNALFGYIGSKGKVCNVGLEDYYVASDDYTIAGIAAINRGTISNCHVSGCISSTHSKRLAGIANSNNDGGIISHCYNAAYIVQNEQIAGSGIAYINYQQATIHNCFDMAGRAENIVHSDKSDRSQYATQTPAEMQSGEVAWLLQHGQENRDKIIWGQLCGKELPQLTSEKPVCRIRFVRQGTELSVRYANRDSILSLPSPQELGLPADEMLFIGNTSLKDTLHVHRDTTIMAAPPHHTLTLTANPDIYGTVEGGGVYPHGDTIHITATPHPHHYFSKWSDGSDEATRQVVLTEDVSLTAYFMPFTALTGNTTDDRWYRQEGRQLHITNAPHATLRIYTTTGQCLYQGPATRLTLPAQTWCVLQCGQYRALVHVP